MLVSDVCLAGAVINLLKMLLTGISSMLGLFPSRSQEELYRGQECEPEQLPLLLPPDPAGLQGPLLKSGSSAAPVLSGTHSHQVSFPNPSCLYKQPTEGNQLPSLPSLFHRPYFPCSQQRWYLREGRRESDSSKPNVSCPDNTGTLWSEAAQLTRTRSKFSL